VAVAPAQNNNMETSDNDEKEEEPVVMVTVGGESYPYHDVTPEMVTLMTVVEKQEYIRKGSDLYKDLYD
jgi:hypothetical protein